MKRAQRTRLVSRRPAPTLGWTAIILLVLAAVACDDDAVRDGTTTCETEPNVAGAAHSLSIVNCRESSDTGYRNGRATAITVVTVDGKPVEKATANAYYAMAQAAAKDGVTLRVVSGFRTMAEQERLYACYVECNCNNCNLAATPGTSNHQSGSALDLNASDPGVLPWLRANAARHGFEATVASENWHYEFRGDTQVDAYCGARFAGASLGEAGQSYPIVARGPVTLEAGETVRGWLRLKNTGSQSWTPGVVWLAPMPRDQASPFAADSWRDATRISTVTAVVAPGAVGEFALDLAGRSAGRAVLRLGFVAEGMTWFADAPGGGGPADGYFAVDVEVRPLAPASARTDAGFRDAIDAGSAPAAQPSDAALRAPPNAPSPPVHVPEQPPEQSMGASSTDDPCAPER
jgi:hypothetical protein